MMYNEKTAFYKMQENLHQLWDEKGVSESYRKWFLQLIDHIDTGKIEEQICREHKKTLENNSLFHFLNRSLAKRLAVMSDLQHSIKREDQTERIGDQIKNLRNANYEVSEALLAINDYAVHKNVMAQFEDEHKIFKMLDLDNNIIRDSYLSQYVLFDDNYDPFLVTPYQSKIIQEQSSTQFDEAKKAFELTASELYKFIRMKKKIIDRLIKSNTGSPISERVKISKKKSSRLRNQRIFNIQNPSLGVTQYHKIRVKKTAQNIEGRYSSLPPIKNNKKFSASSATTVKPEKTKLFSTSVSPSNKDKQIESRESRRKSKKIYLKPVKQAASLPYVWEYSHEDTWDGQFQKRSIKSSKVTNPTKHYEREYPKPLKLESLRKQPKREIQIPVCIQRNQYSHSDEGSDENYKSQSKRIKNMDPISPYYISEESIGEQQSNCQCQQCCQNSARKNGELYQSKKRQRNMEDDNRNMKPDSRKRNRMFRTRNNRHLKQQSQESDQSSSEVQSLEQQNQIRGLYRPNKPYKYYKQNPHQSIPRQRNIRQTSHTPHNKSLKHQQMPSGQIKYQDCPNFNKYNNKLYHKYNEPDEQIIAKNNPDRSKKPVNNKFPSKTNNSQFNNQNFSKKSQVESEQKFSIQPQVKSEEGNYNHQRDSRDQPSGKYHQEQSQKQDQMPQGKFQRDSREQPSGKYHQEQSQKQDEKPLKKEKGKCEEEPQRKFENKDKQKNRQQDNKVQKIKVKQRSEIGNQKNEERKEINDSGLDKYEKVDPIMKSRQDEENMKEDPQKMSGSKGIDYNHRDAQKQSQLKSPQKGQKKILMKPSPIQIQDLLSLIPTLNISPEFRAVFQHSRWKQKIKNKHCFLTNFYESSSEGSSLISFGISAPDINKHQYQILYWGTIQGKVNDKFKPLILNQYLNYLFKFASINGIYLDGSIRNFKEFQSAGFQLNQGRLCKVVQNKDDLDDRHTFIIQCSNISFEEGVNKNFIYSNQIENFNQYNFMANQAITLCQNQTIKQKFPQISTSAPNTIENANQQLTMRNLDTYEVDRENKLQCLLCFFQKYLRLSENFYAFNQYYVTEGHLVTYNSQTESKIIRLCHDDTITLYFGKKYSTISQFIGKCLSIRQQVAKPVKFGIRMFQKSLYGFTEIKNGRQGYGNWIVSCFYKDELKGLIKKSMPQQEYLFGQQLFYISMFDKNELLYCFKVQEKDQV